MFFCYLSLIVFILFINSIYSLNEHGATTPVNSLNLDSHLDLTSLTENKQPLFDEEVHSDDSLSLIRIVFLIIIILFL